MTVRPAAFKRCLANLVSNAARHGSAIAITGNRDHRWLTVTVDDDGPGIPPEVLPDIFDAFVTTKPQGTGLGLPIARTIIESYGGTIWAENRQRGAVFCFTLPLASANA